MRRFTELYLALDSTTKSSEKVDLLAAYFASVEPADGAWALAVLTGGRPRGTPSSRALKELASEVTGFPAWLVDECHAAAGDLSEALALMLGRRGGSTDEPLHETMERRVAPLAGADERERKRIIRGAWEAFDARERFVYHKLLRGGMRVGVQRRTVSRALARVADVAPEVMLHRLAGGVEPTPEAFERVLSGDGGVGREGPYPFFLAHQLNEDPGSALGDRSAWRVEPKWDGIRAQLSVRDGRAALWSRGDEIVTHQFPEIEGAAAALPDGTVLDGEIVAWRDGAALPFAALQTRLNRKAPPTHQLGLFEQETVAFLAFDVLEHEGMDQRARTQRERVEILRRVMEGVPGESPIKLCRPVDAATWADVGAWRAGARERGVEGVVLKHLDSTYGAGRVKPDASGGWWKWKVDPLTVDCVLMYAQLGSGRRAGLYTDYTFGVWEGDPKDRGERALTTFAKAYSGLTQEEIERLDAWIRGHTVGRYGPIRAVEPTQVFELGFDSIQESTRHKSGLGVRFPRILRWRTDKPASEADTVAALWALVPGGGGGPDQ